MAALKLCPRPKITEPIGMLDPLREPDEIDRLLLGMIAKWEHERRMGRLREMDIEEWARSIYNNPNA